MDMEQRGQDQGNQSRELVDGAAGIDEGRRILSQKERDLEEMLNGNKKRTGKAHKNRYGGKGTACGQDLLLFGSLGEEGMKIIDSEFQ